LLVLALMNQDALLNQINQGHSFPYIEGAIRAHRTCLRVSIDRSEFGSLLINSVADPQRTNLLLEDYPTLREVIGFIKRHPAFLSTSRDDGGLCGQQVQYYLDQFAQGAALGACFIIDKFRQMTHKRTYCYVIDGMHRLAAYGLWSQMNISNFPIEAYYCTNRFSV
jgi:hypothetical protein